MSFENLMQKAAQIRAKAHSLAQVDVPPGIDDPILHQGIVEETRRRAAGVPATFEPFTGLPDPAKFDSGIGDLSRAMDRLGTGQDASDPISSGLPFATANPVLEAIDDVKTDIAEWSGKAAHEFRTNFLRPLPAIIKNQFLLVAALRSVLLMEQAMWKAARDDIVSIADTTYNRLDSLYAFDSDDAVVVLTVTASLIGVAAATGSGSVGVLLAVLGGTSSAWADIVGLGAPVPTQITGRKVTEVIGSMERAVQLLTVKIVETEEKLAQAVMSISSQVHEAQMSSDPNNQRFCARRPALANSSEGTIRHDMGYSD